MSDPFESLERTLAQVWQRLARGTKDRRAATRHPTLATISARGPEARTVVLRGVDPQSGTLEIHTDRRSGKVRDLMENAGAALHIWDAKAHLQIRLRCTAALSHGDAGKWAEIPASAQRVYGGTPAPASKIATPEDHDPTPNRTDFTIITLHVKEIETLHLGQDRHRRALFSAPDWHGHWIAP